MNTDKLGRLRELAVCYKLANEFDSVPDSVECDEAAVDRICGNLPSDFIFNRIRVLDRYLGMHPGQITDFIIKEILS
jgi:hypothetical protein